MGYDYDGVVTIGTEINTNGAKKGLKELERELAELEALYDEIEKQDTFIGQADQLRELRERASQARKEIERLKKAEEKDNKPKDNKPKSAQDYNQEAMEDFDKQMAKVNAKLFAQAAIIGVAGAAAGLALSGIERYMQKNEDTANRLKQVGSALRNFVDGLIDAIGDMLGPYIEKLAEWLLKLIGYFNVFIKAISGGKIDLTKKMEQNAKSVDKTSKATKELNKQIAKFDEATKLSDNSRLDAGQTIETPEVEVNFEMPELDPVWVKRIEDFAEGLLTVFGFIKDHIWEILGALGLIKIGQWVLQLGGLIGSFGTATAAGAGLLGVATALALIAACAAGYTWFNVGKTDKELENDLKNRSKEGDASKNVTKKVIDWAKDTTIEKGSDKNTAAYDNMINRIQSSKNIIVQADKTIDEMGKGLLYVNAGLKGNNSVLQTNQEMIKEQTDNTLDYIEAMNAMIDAGKLDDEQKQKYFDTLSKVKTEIFHNTRGMNQSLPAYKNQKRIMEEINETFDKYGIKSDNAVSKSDIFTSQVTGNNKKVKDSIFDMTNQLIGWNNTPMNDKHASVTQTITANVVTTASSLTSFAKNFADAMMIGVQARINAMNAADAVTSSLKKVFGLATGGLINLPGRGVPLGNGVVGGENAVEGVIPLTDSQAMETLGEAIGRYITINANITNTMNGRVISRELQRIDNENTFMGNR